MWDAEEPAMYSHAEKSGEGDAVAGEGTRVPETGNSLVESRAQVEKRWPDVEFKWDEPLANHTTFRVGGPVSCLAIPRTEEALTGLVQEAEKWGIPRVILGGGSNILAADAPMDILVVKVNPPCCSGIRCLDAGDGLKHVYVGGGVGLPRLVGYCLRNGLGGLESLVGIPGTVGGGLVMNAGTRNGCITDPLVLVEFLDREGVLRRIDKADLPIAYRYAGLPEDCVVTGAHFLLKQTERGILKARAVDLMRQRKSTQPLGLPSAGCVFKNPPGLSAGALIQRSGLKGLRAGDAEVSEKHANWIVNLGTARAADIFSLIQYIRQKVFRDFGVLLELEIRVLGCLDEGDFV